MNFSKRNGERLITGITGFIGTNLVEFLSTKTSVKIFGHSRNKASAKIKFSEYNIEFIEKCTAATFDEYKINTIIHLAGIAHDLTNNYTAENYYDANFLGTKHIFDQYTQSKATKFIFFSSIKAAVDTFDGLADETIVPQPTSHYGISKRKAEEYIESSKLKEGKRVYIFRPCMVHGMGNKGNLNLFYRYVKMGLPYPLGAFNNQRSFLNIDNLNFIIYAFIQQDISSGIFHLADSGFLSTRQLYELTAKSMNSKPIIWKTPTNLINIIFSIMGRKAMLTKLTENMAVSNKKVIQQINEPLPVTLEEGLKKTMQSLNEYLSALGNHFTFDSHGTALFQSSNEIWYP